MGLKYATAKKTVTGEIARKTLKTLGETSKLSEEMRLTRLKTKILKERDLVKKIDKAHRISKAHMAKLGLKFDTDLVGMDSKIINQVIVKPSEAKLDNLYKKQYNIYEKLVGNPTNELKKQLIDINKQVKQIVKTTSGRLVGITINPETLEPSCEGLKKKNTFTKFLGKKVNMEDLDKFSNDELSKALSKAVDAEAKRGFVPKDFSKILSNKDS